MNIGQNIKFSDPWELYTSKESLENVQFKFITKKSSFEIFDWPFNVKIVKKVIFCFSKISKTNSKKGLLWDQSWTSVLPGHISYWHFWQVFPYKEFQKTVLISFEQLKKISNFPKLQGCGSKNEPATPISILKWNSSWICQFWS